MSNSLSQKPNSQTNRNPLTGILGGALIFLCAFPVLYFNEAQENLSKVAEQAVEYNEALESSYLGYTVGAFGEVGPVIFLETFQSTTTHGL